MSIETENEIIMNQSVVGDEDLIQEVVEAIIVEEATVVIPDEEQIKVMLGYTIAMAYLLDSSSDATNQPLFDIQHIPLTEDIIQELTQFKVQLYFIVIDRTNSFIALKDSQQFCEYVSVLDDIWFEFEKSSIEKPENQCNQTQQFIDEMVYHQKKFNQFMDQISCVQRAIDLICSDCEKQSSDFGQIFGADILQRDFRKVCDFYTEITDRLNHRVDSLRQTSNLCLNTE